MSEAIAASELPVHLAHAAMMQAEILAVTMSQLDEVAEDTRALDAEDVLALVGAAWQTLRRQQAAMLRDSPDFHIRSRCLDMKGCSCAVGYSIVAQAMSQ